MDLSPAPSQLGELAAAFLQAAITLGLAALFWYLYHRHHRPFFGWWAVAWLLYALRLGAIISFLLRPDRAWLYWHQVATGWTALALLWAALVFSLHRPWRRWYWVAVLFPPLWSYVAIYRLDSFLLAAGPAVAFLSGATWWTAWAFWRHDRAMGSWPARALTVTLVLWGLHHFDYPFLRARGAWNPWGYYLDILFILGMGAGMLLLVHEDLRRGLAERSAELERLAGRMVHHQEEERRRLSRELHDETAQVFSAVKLQLGLAREVAPAPLVPRLDRALELVDEGIQSLRSLTNDLRPALLDDLGLLPALRALATACEERTGLAVELRLPEAAPALSADAELALYRTVQEGLANVARHAEAGCVAVTLTLADGQLALTIRDDGRGLPSTWSPDTLRRDGHVGLAGMRERLVALGGSATIRGWPGGGVELAARLPLTAGSGV
ncbi:MAG: sensor histidine kinase [Gemmatimonadota bacterium]|nr:sensor histidine kinase [Gemmatimonadota bacterium]